MIEASAPGKLLLAGEYAVLHGAPALAVAVDVRARARITAASGPAQLVVPDSGRWRFHLLTDGELRWESRPPDGQGGVLEAVLASLSRAGRFPQAPPALEVELDTRDFHRAGSGGGRQKLGLGSSAAITVALAGALLAEPGDQPEPAALLGVCLEAHRALQAGAGSGADVAAAVHGGVVGVGVPDAPGGIVPLVWPAGLHWLAVWSGQGASTPVMLRRFAEFRAAQPEAFGRQLARLSGLAQTALDAWRRGLVPAILAALAEYGAALRDLDAVSGLGIWTPAHDRIALCAREVGVVYKTSGAGGGDFGIALASAAEPLRELAARFAREGLVTLAGTDLVPGLRYGTKR